MTWSPTCAAWWSCSRRCAPGWMGGVGPATGRGRRWRRRRAMVERKPLRSIVAPFVAPGPSGVAIRDRLRVSAADADVLRRGGAHLGSVAAGDLAARRRDGLGHDKDTWAARKRH